MHFFGRCFVGLLAGEGVESVERTSVSFTSGDSSKSVTITPVVSTRSWVRISSTIQSAGGQEEPREFLFAPSLNAAGTQVTIFRKGSTLDADVEIEVVQFSAGAGVSVNHLAAFNLSTSSTTTPQTISSVTLSETFPIAYSISNQGSFNRDDACIYTFPNSTTFEVEMEQASPGANAVTCYAQIVSISGAAVEFVQGNLNGTNSNTQTISSVTLNKSFITDGGFHADVTTQLANNAFWNCEFVSSTQVKFYRYKTTATETKDPSVYVVQAASLLNSTQEVIDTMVGADGKFKTLTISTIDDSKSFTMTACYQQSFCSSDQTGDIYSRIALASKILSATTYELHREGNFNDVDFSGHVCESV